MDLDKSSPIQSLPNNNMVVSRHRRHPSQDSVGVEAGNDIPAGSFISLGMTELVLGHDLLDDKRLQQEPTSSTDCCVKVYWRNDRLEISGEETLQHSWLQLLRCARDRHEQNLELVKGEDGFFAYTMKNIEKGEELLIWYREGLAREVGVPILTPCHIRGHQMYVCTGCQADYTHPNTLKAHMFLQCRKTLVSSSSDEDSLVPFHLLLQTLSQTSTNSPSGLDQDRSSLHKYIDSRLVSASSSGTLSGSSGCGHKEEEITYKSAFRTLTSARSIKKETSDDGFMTPDSSTDQSSVLNLSVKMTEACNPVENINKRSFHTAHQWGSLTAQRVMAQSISIPIDYTSVTDFYPATPHLHAFGIQFMSRGQANLSQAHSSEASCGGSLCCSADCSLISSRMEGSRERLGISLFKPHTSASSSFRQIRPNNPYGFALPSDKEPLDLLPQAYFANKSKKGHLCLCCGKLYSRKYGLKIHMRTHNGYKPLKCKICSRPFGDPSNLNKHVRLHAQGETPYRCDYCGKVLVRRRDLERHVRSRHPMGCIQNDDAIGICESSPDSSPIRVECSENSLVSTEPSYDNS